MIDRKTSAGRIQKNTRQFAKVYYTKEFEWKRRNGIAILSGNKTVGVGGGGWAGGRGWGQGFGYYLH